MVMVRNRKSPSGAEKLTYINLVKTCSPSGRIEDTVLPASEVLRGIMRSEFPPRPVSIVSSPSSCYPGNQRAQLLGNRCHTCVLVFPMSPEVTTEYVSSFLNFLNEICWALRKKTLAGHTPQALEPTENRQRHQTHLVSSFYSPSL